MVKTALTPASERVASPAAPPVPSDAASNVPVTLTTSPGCTPSNALAPPRLSDTAPRQRPEAQLDQRPLRFGLPAAAVTDNQALDLGRVLVAGGAVTHVALGVDPGVAVAGVHLQHRLEPAVAAVHAALHERHGLAP